MLLGVVLAASVTAAASYWESRDRAEIRIDDTVSFLGRDASADEIAKLLGLEVWRFRYRSPEGCVSRLIELRLREPGGPLRSFGGGSSYWGDMPDAGAVRPPEEIVIGLTTEWIDGKNRLYFATIAPGENGRSGAIELPFGIQGRVAESPYPIAEHEYAIRWSRQEGTSTSSRDTPDLAHDTIWSIYLGPVPPEREARVVPQAKE
jgi:hypothetical protein